MRRGFTLVELMIAVAIIGLLAALAIPNFIKFQAKSKQSEAKTNLKAIFTAERTFFAEHDTYENFSKVGFMVERGNRYAYTVNTPVGEAQVRTALNTVPPSTVAGYDQLQVDCFRFLNGACNAVTPAVPAAGGNVAYVAPTVTAQTGINAPPTLPGLLRGTTGSLIAQATGNVDNDVGADCWDLGISVTLTIAPSVCADLGTAPTGQPMNSWNDAICD